MRKSIPISFATPEALACSMSMALLNRNRSYLLAICSILAFAGQVRAQQIMWKTLSLPIASAGRYDDIFFISPQVGWAIDGGHVDGQSPVLGRIYKTIDGGTTWNLQFDSALNYLRSIRFVDSLHGWVGTLGLDIFAIHDTTILYETTDGGATWLVADSKIQGTKPAGLCGMFAVDTDNIYICGKFAGPAYILKTNSGKSWQSIDMNAYAGRLIDIYFWSRDSGIVVGGTASDTSHALVLLTTDGAKTWSVKYWSKTPEGWGWKISFPTRSLGYVSVEHAPTSQGGSFLTTTDRGMSWTARSIGTPDADLQGIGFINERIGWIGGWMDGVYTTTDGGSSWAKSNQSTAANRFRFFGDTLAYCAGQQLYKIAVTSPNSVSKSILPADLDTQNYPNPFVSSTTIMFTLPREEQVIITLFDMEGRKISDVVKANFSSGTHSIKINEPQLPTGAIFYQLSAGGRTIERRILHLR
jgi:photosystem II stability/assembly factor-like uncharacterized protein